MKTFSQFISEQSASQQAARMGLNGNGHGDCYDDKGEFIAKTVGGKLKFYNKRQRTPGQDPPQTEREKNLSYSSTYKEPAAPEAGGQVPQNGEVAPQETGISPDLEAGPPPVPKTKGTLTIGFGRFNPPHAGHGQLMDIAANSVEGEGDDYIIIPSRTQDKKKNPFDADSKIQMMRSLSVSYTHLTLPTILLV